MVKFVQILHDDNWGDLASVVGVAISIIGFVFTIIGLKRSKNATQRVTEAVTEVKHKLSLQAAATDLLTLMNDIEEIKVLHRFGFWGAMPSRYSSLRKRLFSVKGNCPTLTKAQKAAIQGAIEQFKGVEEIVEVALASNQTPPDVALLNKLATEQGDRITAVLIAIQNATGDEK